MIRRLTSRNGWTYGHLWGAVAAVALGVAATFEVWRDLAYLGWKDEECSHILLAPLTIAWLVWVRRRRLRLCRPTGKILGTAVLAAGWVAWSYGYRHDIHTLWHGGAILVVTGALLTVLGKDILMQFLPAFAALIFLIPVAATRRQQITVRMEMATAEVTQQVCQTLGMPVERHAASLSLNGTPVQIEEACNGMRMVLTLILVSYVFAFVTPLRGHTRLLIVALSPVTAMVCNVIRLVPTVWMFGHASTDAALRFHDISGWVMLVVAFLLLMGVVRLLRWALVPVAQFTLAAA